MNNLAVLTFFLFLLLTGRIYPETKTLGDWAKYHREADNLCRENKHKESANLYRQVIKGRLPLQGNQHRDVGVTWNNLGVALYYQGENEKAQEAYEKAIRILLPAVGAQHPDILAVQTNLAVIEESKKQFRKC